MLPLSRLLVFKTILGLGIIATPVHSATPKNIIFLSFDELAATQLGCYGSGVGSTPAMDRLASQGTRFDRAYPVTPVCSPSRASWLTGRSPVIHGVIFNNLVLAPTCPLFLCCSSSTATGPACLANYTRRP